MKSLGFTGTRLGPTEAQEAQIYRWLVAFAPREVHHGDCVGCDEHFHELAKSLSVEHRPTIHVHPPREGKHRAFCEGDIVHEPKDYSTRNSDIVKASDALIAVPYSPIEITRSGTWSTVRRAEKKGIPIYIVHFDGKIEYREVRPVVW